MSWNDTQYFLERASAERGLARTATNPRAKAAHQQMAERYETLVVANGRRGIARGPAGSTDVAMALHNVEDVESARTAKLRTGVAKPHGEEADAECVARAQRCRDLAEAAQSHSIRQMLLERARCHETQARSSKAPDPAQASSSTERKMHPTGGKSR